MARGPRILWFIHVLRYLAGVFRWLHVEWNWVILSGEPDNDRRLLGNVRAINEIYVVEEVILSIHFLYDAVYGCGGHGYKSRGEVKCGARAG